MTARQFALTRPSGSGLLAAAAAVIAALFCLTLFLGNNVMVLLLAVISASVIAFWLSGNLRLAALWCTILAASLSFSINFMVVPHMGGAGSYTVDLVDPFLIILLTFILRDRVQAYRGRLRIPAAAWWWTGMIVLGVISAVVGPLRHSPMHEVLRMSKLLVLLFVIANELVRRRQFVNIVSALAIVILIQSAVAIAQFLLQRTLGLEILGEASAATLELVSQATFRGGGASFRVSGLQGHPNFLSASLAMLLPVFAAALLANFPPREKLLAAMALMLGSVALLLTLSRSGWIAFALAIIILLGLSLVHPRLRSRYVGARIFVIGSAAAVGAIFSPQIIRRLTMSDPGALSFRYEWMEVAWNMGQENPIIGLGLNTFVFHLPGNTRFGGAAGLTERFGDVWPVVHNIYLLVWAEQGTLGFLCFVGFHIAILWVAIRNMRRYVDGTLFAINLGCFAGFIAIMFDGIGSFYIRSPAGARLFFIVVAMIYAIDYWNKANRPRPGTATSTMPAPGATK